VADCEGLLVVVDGLWVAALLPVDEPEAGQRAGFTDPETDVAADRKGLLVVIDGLWVAALLPVDEPEAGQRAGLGGLVVGVVGGVLDVGVEGQRVMVMAIDFEVAVEHGVG
jgi:hypothetical protein